MSAEQEVDGPGVSVVHSGAVDLDAVMGRSLDLDAVCAVGVRLALDLNGPVTGQELGQLAFEVDGVFARATSRAVRPRVSFEDGSAPCARSAWTIPNKPNSEARTIASDG